jgi:hypothetical protein
MGKSRALAVFHLFAGQREDNLQDSSSSESIMLRLPVHNIKSIPNNPGLLDDFLTAYQRDFDIIGCSSCTIMDNFIGLYVEQLLLGAAIKLHLDNYIKEIRSRPAEFRDSEYDRRELRGQLAYGQETAACVPNSRR